MNPKRLVIEVGGVEIAKCPRCSGGLVCREIANVRRTMTYRQRIGADAPNVFRGKVLRCIDCGYRRAIISGLEVIE